MAKGDRVLGTYAPAISTYPNSTEGIGTPSVHTGLVDDVYLTLISSPNAQREITLGVRINALIVWLWIGGGFMALGTILALSPRLRRRPRSISSDDLAPAPLAAPDESPEPDSRGGAGVKHPARIAALAVAVVVVVFGVVLALNVGGDPQDDAKQSQLVGQARARVRPAEPRGGRVKLADIAGKSAIVNFWNSWCIPCREEEPVLEQFYAAHKDDPDFVMIGIVRDDETGDVKAYVKDNGVGWTVALDPGSVAALDFGTRGQPETYAISPSGTVAAAKFGPMATGSTRHVPRRGAADRVSGP